MEEVKTKTCSKCFKEKPLLEFHFNSRSQDFRHAWCKECKKGHDSTRRGGIKVSYEKILELIEKQLGRCAICKRILGDKFHTDHDHRTNSIRGILCKKCNWMLGQADDNPDILIKAVEYLISFEKEV